jgi:hypothetical protein
MKKAKVNRLLGLIGIFALSFSTQMAYAQDSDDEMRQFFGGLSAGSNFSQVTGDYMEGWNRFGLNVSGFTYFKLAEQFAGCFEMSYSQKGSRPKQSELPYPSRSGTKFYNKVGISLPYAEVPLTFNYFYKGESHIGAGLSYGRLFNAKEWYDTIRTETIYPFKKGDVSFVLNGNIRATKHWYVNFRLTHSLLNIRDKENMLVPHRTMQQNKLLTLRALYLF